MIKNLSYLNKKIYTYFILNKKKAILLEDSRKIGES